MENPEALRIRSAKEAAAILGISLSRLNRFRCEGGGPVYCKLGSGSRARVGYRLADLDSWLQSCTRKHTSEAA